MTNKKKKILGYFVGVLGLFSMAYFSYKIYKAAENKKEIEERRSEISAFQLQTLDGKVFTNEDLEPNKNILFLFFNSGCEICRIEGNEISRIAKEFRSTHIYFISSESVEEIMGFKNEKELNQPNITFLKDDSSFTSNYDVSSVPFMCLYSKTGELIKIYKGGIKPELILKDAERIH